jgi:methyltransferase
MQDKGGGVGFYTGLLVLIAIERMLELRISKRHERQLVASGQTVMVEPMYALMVAVHAGVLLGAWAEVALLDRPFRPLLGGVALLLFAGATALRWWTIKTLGEQWTVRVVAGNGMQVETRGPFRYLRHPNYLGVAIEVFAIPLIHSAFWTALLFGSLNLLVLWRRVKLEEATLDWAAGYRKIMQGKARWVPGRSEK